jgi:selenocysteine-specific elongation factor
MAGHVDHGKSSLVRALTGLATDRLAEERRRGITIELGFTVVTLDGERHGVVDVPGHEDFVRTMVAGASGIDVALLVVAADDGIMPQTREHLLVLEQLRVTAGIPVITKVDLVEPEWTELVRNDVDATLARSPVLFAPAIAVSVRTGQGLEALRRALAAVSSAPRHALRPRQDLFRLPIDRAFVVEGVGTVVTGTVWSGAVHVGDSLQAWPGGHTARVRSIEVHSEAQLEGAPGRRTALALSGVTLGEVGRGSVLVAPGAGWQESRALDVEIELAREGPTLRDGDRAWVHHGTAAILARVRLASALRPGGRATARLRLESPIVARGGDRFVLRSYSPVAVFGGGTVLDPQPVAGRPSIEWHAEAVSRVRTLVERRRWGIGVDELAVLAGVAKGAPGPEAAETDARDTVSRAGLLECGGRILPATRLDDLAERALAAVDDHHRGAFTEPGMPLELLRSMLRAPNRLVDEVLRGLVRNGRLIPVAERVALPGFAARAAASDEEVRRVREALSNDGLAARTVGELLRDLGFDPYRVLKHLEKAGLVVMLGRDHFAWSPALDGFRRVLESAAQAGPITPAIIRERTGLTRKHLIPLLEWADRAGLTVREGDVRRLRQPTGGSPPR